MSVILLIPLSNKKLNKLFVPNELLYQESQGYTTFGTMAIGIVESTIPVLSPWRRLASYLWRSNIVIILLYLHKDLGHCRVEGCEVVLYRLFDRFKVCCLSFPRVLFLSLTGGLELIIATSASSWFMNSSTLSINF